MRFKNNNSPRITRMYGEKNSPKEGNMIPDIVEARIEKESTSRILVS
jgi:DNA polymerase III alpha subunit (gram-positive type)